MKQTDWEVPKAMLPTTDLEQTRFRQAVALATLRANHSTKAARKYLYGPWAPGSAGRPAAFLQMHSWTFRKPSKSAGEAFWRWLGDAWPMFDAIPHARLQWHMARWRPYWTPACMSRTDRRIFEGLDEATPIQVFRGQDLDHKPGLSWTSSRAVAEGFAQGHRRFVHRRPGILAIAVCKEDIAMALGGREEHEIVLFRAPKKPRISSRAWGCTPFEEPLRLPDKPTT